MLAVIVGGMIGAERIASNVAVGIGFVGAGVIFKGQSFYSKVSGITSAATIWVTAAPGIGIGAGYELLAFAAAVLVLVVLLTFTLPEGWIDRVNQIRNYGIVCDFENAPSIVMKICSGSTG